MIYESSLTAAHRTRGVTLSPFKGALLPDAFGELAAEVTAAGEGAALADLGWLGHVRVTGRHRQRFLHGKCTCQVTALGAGEGNFGMVLDGKGKLVAQFALDVEAEALRMELGREDAERTVAHLLRYKVADRVDFAPEPGLAVLALVGPRAADVLARLGLSALPGDAYAFVDTELAGVPARLRRTAHRLGLPGCDVTLAADAAATAWEALVGAGATPIGQRAWDALRVKTGSPVDGVDMDGRDDPLEAERLAASIDWDKGCYLGQEVVCMMNDRGQPARLLRGVALSAGPAPAPGAELFAVPDGDKAVARLGTTTRLPGHTEPLGLAVVKKKHAAHGTVLHLADGRSAEVLALPLTR